MPCDHCGVKLKCMNCGTETATYQSVNEALKAAVAHGWQIGATHVICPDCKRREDA